MGKETITIQTGQAKQSALKEILSKYITGSAEQIDAVSGLSLEDQRTYTNTIQRGPAGKTLLPTNVGTDTTRSSLNWDYINNKQGRFGVAPQTTVPETPGVAAPTTPNPAGIDNNLYAKYKSSGLSDDQIGRIHGATPETPFSDIFKKTEVEPEPINEARVNASRNVANLGEGIKVLGDMFAVGQGARVSKRNAGDIVNAQATKEDTERNKYLTKLEGFKAGERQATEKDWMLAFQNREKRAGEVRDDMKEMRAREYADKKDIRDFKFREDQAAESKRQFEVNKKLQEKGLAIRADKASTTPVGSGGKSTPKTTTSKKGQTTVMIDGKLLGVNDAVISDVAARAKKDGGLIRGGKSIYEGQNDLEIFEQVKKDYVKYLGNGKIGTTDTPGNWNTGKGSSKGSTKSTNIEDIAAEFEGTVVKKIK